MTATQTPGPAPSSPDRTAAGLVAYLADLDVRLTIEGSQLRVDAPRGVLTPALKAQLAEHKADVLALLARPTGGESTRRVFPLSYAQERLWFLDRLQPGQPLYVMSWAYQLRGPLDVPALTRAFGDLVARHDVLRTVIVVQDGDVVQRVRPAEPVSLPCLDLTGSPPAARSAEVLRLAQAERDQPFDLTAGPMLRGQLLHLAPDDQVLLVSVHHIACDGWSLGVLWRELAVLYAAQRTGDRLTLPAPRLQYGDYAVWQRRVLASGAWDDQMAYWQRQLHGLAPLALPYDRSRSTTGSPRGDAIPFAVPPALTAQLRALAQAEGATLYMLLLAALQALLADLCGQDDVAIGTPVAARDRVELESLVGFVANTLVLRSSLAGGPTFRQLLQQVRRTVLAALEHQAIPFDQVVAALRPARQPGQNPFFQVLFQLAAFDDAAPRLDGISVERLRVPGGHAKFDLELLLRETGDTLSGRLVFDAQLFDRATIERRAEQLVALLHDVADDPDRRVGTEECRTPTCGSGPHLGMRTPLMDRADAAVLTGTEAALVSLWCEILGLPRVGIHDDFFALGGHSLGAIRLCTAVEQRLGVLLPVATLFRAPTIAQLAVELAVGLSDDDWSSVVPIQVEGARPPFFCVHGFAGGVGAYAVLAQALGSDQPFYGLQAAGVDGRLPPDGTIEAMAARYVADMRRVQPVGPYHVGGYCFGGVVAFEMARQLTAQGEAPARVVIIEGMAPRRFHRRLAPYDLRRWQTLWRSLPFWFDEYRALGGARLQRRAQAKIGRRWKEFRQRAGYPVALGPQDLIDADLSTVPEHLSTLMVTHLQALRRYAPQPSAVRVTLFRAQLQTMSKVLFGALDPEYGWGSLAQRGVDVRPIAAGHRTIHLPPQVSALADALKECLMDET